MVGGLIDLPLRHYIRPIRRSTPLVRPGGLSRDRRSSPGHDAVTGGAGVAGAADGGVAAGRMNLLVHGYPRTSHDRLGRECLNPLTLSPAPCRLPFVG
jgi:hypothetical protein